MKYLIALSLFIAGCAAGDDAAKLPGTYFTTFDNEYGNTDDTLFLSKSNEASVFYEIKKHAGIVKKKNGSELPKEVVTESWTLEYDPVKESLFEKRKGKTLIWNKENNTLRLGKLVYKRIND